MRHPLCGEGVTLAGTQKLHSQGSVSVPVHSIEEVIKSYRRKGAIADANGDANGGGSGNGNGVGGGNWDRDGNARGNGDGDDDGHGMGTERGQRR